MIKTAALPIRLNRFTRTKTISRGMPKWTLSIELSELGWAVPPKIMYVQSHVTDRVACFCLDETVQCAAAGDIQLWIYTANRDWPTSPDMTLHVYND